MWNKEECTRLVETCMFVKFTCSCTDVFWCLLKPPFNQVDSLYACLCTQSICEENCCLIVDGFDATIDLWCDWMRLSGRCWTGNFLCFASAICMQETYLPSIDENLKTFKLAGHMQKKDEALWLASQEASLPILYHTVRVFTILY